MPPLMPPPFPTPTVLNPLPDWMLAAPLQRVMAALTQQDADAVRVVGGAVRDHLLGLAVRDVDLATTLTPLQAVAALSQVGIKTLPTGIDHGTITALLDDTAIEITTLRQDVATDGRHAVVRFGTDWRADAARRDFTINALYLSPTGQLFDYHQGLADLAARRVRFIGNPHQRIQEDVLRLLRFFRFSASYAAELDADGLTAAITLSPQLPQLSGERVWAELSRLLTLGQDGLAMLRVMATHAILPQLWLPAVIATPDLASLQALLRADPQVPPALLQLAVLIGGAVTPATLKSLAGRLRLSNQQRRQWQLWQAGWRCWHSQDRLDWLDWIYLHGLPAGQESLAWWEATRATGVAWETTWAAGQQEGESQGRQDATENLPENQGGQDADTPALLADARQQALDVMRRLGDARFATNGDDLLAAGYPPGAALANQLRTLRRAWLADLLCQRK
ncbi:MAG: CCA tRNA nucleotidyltransferase [Holosporaceae bacterium]|jgi:poly(A) polymerase|nr:CCA tRNA nucleotidyltransferase [Rhodospirillaceae bacterium]